MNLRNAIEVYANAVSSRDYYEIVGNGKQNAESVARLAVCSQSLDVVLAVAEAAIALSEHLAFTVFDPKVESVVYCQELEKLWRAFMEAHKAAKDANQS